jgi:hypothetical protein
MNFLLFGTLWFWVALVVLSIAVIYFLEDALSYNNDDGGGGLATLAIITFAMLYYWFGSKEDVVKILTYIRDNPTKILLYFLAYVAVGIVWAFVKWYFFVHSRYEKSKADKKDYHNRTLVVPTARDNKFRIMSWMYYWPFSGLWTLINEPLKKSFKYVFSKISATFDRISNHMFSDLIQEEEKQKQEEINRNNERNANNDRKQLNS